MVKVATFPHGDWGNDAADWHGDPDVYRRMLDEAEAQAKLADEPKPPRYYLVTPDELASQPPAEYRIKRFLPAVGVAAVYGPPKSGKTFLVMDAAAAITEGRTWFGYRTKPCSVVYVGLEGAGGLAQRWLAYRTVRGDAGKDRLRFTTVELSLLLANDITDLAHAIREAGFDAGVVIIDTLNAASPGADENSSVDMGRIIAGAKRLQSALGGLVLLVHHSGKDVMRGLRGHSSLSGSLDAIIEVTRDAADNRNWSLVRAKDLAEIPPVGFRLDVVELGTDRDGDPITSCVVAPVELSPAMRKKSLGKNERPALKALSAILKASGDYGKGNAPSFRPCVTWDAAVAAIAPTLAVDPKRKAERAAAAIRSLCDVGEVAHFDGWLWLP